MSIYTVQHEPLESPDGVRVLFTLPSVYLAGSTWLFVGGTKQRFDDGAWSEVPPNQILMTVAPYTELIIEVEYEEA